MHYIKLMPDYGCSPLWWDEPNLVGNIEPEELPLSNTTIEALYQWSEVSITSLDWDDPSNSFSLLVDDIKIFEHEGLRLWLLLKEELGSDYFITYKSHYLHKVFFHPNELRDALLTIK